MSDYEFKQQTRSSHHLKKITFLSKNSKSYIQLFTSILLKEKYKNKIALNFSIYLQWYATEVIN